MIHPPFVFNIRHCYITSHLASPYTLCTIIFVLKTKSNSTTKIATFSIADIVYML